MNLNRIFGKRLRELRKARSLTQEALAERSGLSVDGVRRLERGAFSPSLHTTSSLCRGLQVSLTTMFSSLEGKPKAHVDELRDYLATRSPAELDLVWRVLRALFEGNAGSRRKGRKRGVGGASAGIGAVSNGSA